MPANITHPSFKQPEDGSALIWRYLDLGKYISMLKSGALHFSRLDQFSDPFEGTISKKGYEEIKAAAAEGEAKKDIPIH